MPTSSAQAAAFTFDHAVAVIQAGETSADEAAERLIAQMSDEELLWLLDGDTPLRDLVRMVKKFSTVASSGGSLPRLGIPGVRFSDGPRGVVLGNSTAFPVTIARAATWEPDLEERVGRSSGLEARAAGANYSGAVCVNLLRHPAWGRAQECYGEDPVLTGQMGAGLTRGLRRNVMACVKHFALNSMENARFKVDVTVDEHALHEVYLPHFKTVVDAGVDSVMSSYNSVNGESSTSTRFCSPTSCVTSGVLPASSRATGCSASTTGYVACRRAWTSRCHCVCFALGRCLKHSRTAGCPVKRW